MDEHSTVLPALKDLIPAERIALDVEACDWRDAIRVSGELLVVAQIVEPRYVDAMIRTAEELGPYIVIAPHIALPHARPEDGVLETGLSLVRLRTPVEFGHDEHDPVILLFGLAAKDKRAHIRALQTLAEILSTKHLKEELMEAKTTEKIHLICEKAEELGNEC
jgi:mannitol/fructose-specific phosphotransferase system IIA component (Ntr-type)